MANENDGGNNVIIDDDTTPTPPPVPPAPAPTPTPAPVPPAPAPSKAISAADVLNALKLIDDLLKSGKVFVKNGTYVAIVNAFDGLIAQPWFAELLVALLGDGTTKLTKESLIEAIKKLASK